MYPCFFMQYKQMEKRFMYILKTEASFDSAHFLAGYNGKCSNLHGDRWKIVLEVQTEELKEDVQHKGMYVDFGELKKDLRNIADSMDHALIIERNSLKETTFEALKSENFKIIELDFRPTAENMAKYFYEKIKKARILSIHSHSSCTEFYYHCSYYTRLHARRQVKIK